MKVCYKAYNNNRLLEMNINGGRRTLRMAQFLQKRPSKEAPAPEQQIQTDPNCDEHALQRRGLIFAFGVNAPHLRYCLFLLSIKLTNSA